MLDQIMFFAEIAAVVRAEQLFNKKQHNIWKAINIEIESKIVF